MAGPPKITKELPSTPKVPAPGSPPLKTNPKPNPDPARAVADFICPENNASPPC